MIVIFFVLQSLDPLPMRGPELGVQADDIEVPDIEPEPKQEVLENKDVRIKSEWSEICSFSRLVFEFSLCFSLSAVSGHRSAGSHRRPRSNQRGPADL